MPVREWGKLKDSVSLPVIILPGKKRNDHPLNVSAYARLSMKTEEMSESDGLATEEILEAYIECAFWLSNDDKGKSFDNLYSRKDLASETLDQMRKDCFDFFKKNEELINESSLSLSQVGHDFWLTRNGHGAGFWDRGDGEVFEKLTQACKEFKEVDLYVGDDGKIYT